MGETAATASLLRRAPNLVVTLLSNGEARIRTPHDTLDGGPHTLAVLDLFSTPRSIDDALSALRTHGAQDYIEASSLIVRFQEEGVLVDATGPAPAARPSGFDAPSIHAHMLDDDVRTLAYFRALKEVVRPGDVAIDIGTGTGVLAIAAARAGARHVYAIESGAIAQVAREIVETNGLSDRITVTHGRSTAVTLPERADLLVTETIGHDPFAEGIVECVRDARRRLLNPGARVIPQSLAARVVPVDLPREFVERSSFAESRVEGWRSSYGIDFSPLAAYAKRTIRWTRVPQREASGWRTVGPAVTVAEIHFATDDHAAIDDHVDIAIEAAAEHLGLLCYFDAQLAPGLSLSTGPSESVPPLHWQAIVYHVPDRPRVEPGQTVRVAYSYSGGSSALQVL